MEIKRNFEKLVVTKRRFVIYQTPSAEQTVCAKCGEPMLTAEQAAGLFSIPQRRIFQIIETDAAHYTETETGATLVCLKSLANILEANGSR